MKFLKIIIIIILLTSCDKGLEPPEVIEPAILTGKITYINNWPDDDSLFAVRIAAFKAEPGQGLVQEVIDGNAYFNLETMPFNVDSTEFELIIDEPPLTLNYIAVAWQYEDNLESQRVIGIYSLNNDDTPASIDLDPGEQFEINIEVNWDDLPPQPF